MIKGFAFLTVFSSLTCGQAALAQGALEAPTGSRIGQAKPAYAPRDLRLSQVDRARATTDQFADCLVTSLPRRTIEYRNMPYDMPDSAKMLRGMATGECLSGGQLNMPSDLLRGAIFRNYFLRDFKSPAVSIGGAPVDFSRYVANPNSSSASQYRLMMSFGGCVVRADAVDSVAYVRSSPGSKAEKDALVALKPVLGPCYPSGGRLALSKSFLTATLAEALYREAEAGKQSLAEVSR